MNIEVLVNCFPSRYREDVQEVCAQLDLHSKLDPRRPFQVVIEGEGLAIPQRIYSDESQLENIDILSRTQQEISLCFFSRHHNGFVRERCLKEMIGSKEDFVAPFVLQLLGEYIIEIIEYIYQNKEFLNKPAFKKFIAENPAFYNLIWQRIYSYWDCYCRMIYPKYKRHVEPKGLSMNDHPGIKMIRYIDMEIIAKCP